MESGDNLYKEELFKISLSEITIISLEDFYVCFHSRGQRRVKLENILLFARLSQAPAQALFLVVKQLYEPLMSVIMYVCMYLCTIPFFLGITNSISN